MRQSLIHYWRTHLAVLLGAAVTTAVLTGALIVGDSLKGSLRELTLARLGTVDWALVGGRPFRSSLAGDLAVAGSEPVPLLMLRAAATAADSGARASKVTLWGVDERFFALHPTAEPIDLATRSSPFPAAALNQALAAELGLAPGAELLLSFQRPSDVPRETLVGREQTADTVEILRLSVAQILPNRGAGSFGLEPRQTRALNVFVDLRRLQRTALGRGVDRVNVLLAPLVDGEPADLDQLNSRLRAALVLEDLGLEIAHDQQLLTLHSRQFVLDEARATAAAQAAHEAGAASQPVLTYLATSITHGERTIPYSTISALDPPSLPALGEFQLVDGTPAPALEDDEILLNAWAARDLEAAAGDTIEVGYFELGARDELTTTSRSFRLRGVLAMTGLAVDPRLTPEFPGIQDADDIAAWDPPFPVDLDRIRTTDEEYWDSYRATPKAFVSERTGRALWHSRFGDLTSMRIAAKESADSAKVAEQFTAGLLRRLDPHAAGLVVHPVRTAGLEAARGATDFAGLFIGLSLFLIVAAALLAGLLFRLGVERRAPEIGLLRASGFTARRVRRRFLGEGLALAAVGALLGLAGGAAYAGALLAGLRSWWLPAIGEPVLFLHLVPRTLALGWLLSLVVVGLAIAGALRRLERVSIVALLAGGVTVPQARKSRRSPWLALGALGLAAALTTLAFTLDARAAAGLAFGVGAALLTAGIAFFAHASSRRSGAANALGKSALTLARRNSGRNPARSLLCVTLMACASFVIVVVAANRLHREIDVTDPASGAGGFSLIAESDVPIFRDLAAESPGTATALDGAQAVPFRLLPGEDVSCLNLYQPERPRLLGAPPEMIARGGFSFRQTTSQVDNPWQLLAQPLADGAIPAIGDYNSVLWILHSGLGQDLVIDNERGEPIRLRFVGLLAKSLFQSEIVISEAQFQRHFPSRAGYSYFLLDPPPANAPAVATALENELARLGFDAVATSDRLAAFQAVEDTYLSTFQTLGGLGLLLGTLGMGIILLRNVLERRAELATLRAIGYRRARLRQLVLLENAFLLLIGLAIGAGAGAAATTPHLIAVGARLPWQSLTLTLAAVFAVGMASSALAVRAVARLPLLASLRAG